MLDSVLMTEVMADQKRRMIEDRIARAHISEIASADAMASIGIRGVIAAAIVRFGIFLDGTAGRRAAAVQG
jgi:hypothetical protein